MTKLTIKPLQKKDHNKVIQFAIQGMNFDRYSSNPLFLQLYGRYFWYLELARASQVLAAYEGEELAGVLLAEMKHQPKVHRNSWQNFYVKSIQFLLNCFSKEGSGKYDNINQELLKKYQSHYQPDGEIIFLAANPDSKTRGIGSLLLETFERQNPNKEIYLYTDSGCTYQFYEKRGFERHGASNAKLHLGKDSLDLQCFLYRKRIAIQS